MPALDLLAWIIILFWAFLLAGGYLSGRRSRAGALPLWSRAGSAILLVSLAWYGYALGLAMPTTGRFSLFIAIGVSCCFAGEPLARLLRPPASLTLSLLAFVLSHVAFTFAILVYGPIVWSAWGVCLLLGPVLVVALGLRRGVGLPVLSALLLYALLLSSTTGLALGLAIQRPLFGVLVAGTALLSGSELLLALARFHIVRHPTWIWHVLGPGQLLVALSIWSALQI